MSKEIIGQTIESKDLIVDCKFINCTINNSDIGRGVTPTNCIFNNCDFKDDRFVIDTSINTFNGCKFKDKTIMTSFRKFFKTFSNETDIDSILSALESGPLKDKIFHSVKMPNISNIQK